MGKEIEKRNVRDWRKISRRRDVAKALEKVPDRDFKLMLQPFRSSADADVSWGDLLTAVHIAYSWMPTMLWAKNAPLQSKFNTYYWRTSRLAVLNRILSDHKTKVSLYDDVRRLKEVTNNSVVGLSKVLHIFDPKSFPVWDSRVASVYLKPARIRNVTQKIQWYLDWVRDSREWARNEAVKVKIRELKGDCICLRGVPALRVVELVFFNARLVPRKKTKSEQKHWVRRKKS